MPNLALLNQEGSQVGEITLNADIFGIEPHEQALFDAVLLQRASLRQGTHKTKTRTEVRGGGRKPWKQKGTGRARQGSIRSPQWRGGGVVFGPTPRSYNLKMNRKVRRLALKSALSFKVLESELVVLNELTLAAPKTKEMVGILNNLNVDKKVLLVVGADNDNALLAARNIASVKIIPATGVNVLDLLDARKVIMTQDAVKHIEEVLA
ncbi:MAG: 50S ribosomal protein L4 [Defluviitaleaceae bacterium]|nr:50S ribosomal protein L4 [Defluviitaleaceae bacterium]